jgi:hypothetical protein
LLNSFLVRKQPESQNNSKESSYVSFILLTNAH